MTTAANLWRFLVYHIIDFVQKLLRKQLLYFFLYFIIDFLRKWRESSHCDDFAGNCIRVWDVWRSTFCLIFALILRKSLQELAFFLDHFTSFNWNFVFL